jgi:hypothetical protein
MFWNILASIHASALNLADLWLLAPIAVGLMFAWDNPQSRPNQDSQSIYDFSFNNPMGLSSNGNWNSAQLGHVDPNQFNYQRPDAYQQGNAADINRYLTNEGVARQTFGLTPGNSGSGAGAPLQYGAGGAQNGAGMATNAGTGGASAAGTGAGAGAGAGGWGGWVRGAAGLAGAYASYADSQSANAAARANSGPQNYSNTSSTNPWGPSTDYRTLAMDRAMQLLNGGGGGGGGRGGRGGGGGGGGNGGGGSWGNSSALANAMSQAALGGDPNVTAGADYLQNALNDPYGGSQLLGRTFEAADGLNNPALDQFVQQMMGQYGGGAGSGPSAIGGRSGSSYSGGGGGGGGTNHPLVGVGGDIRAMLDADYTANPELQAMIDQVNRGTTESYQQGLAGLSAQSEASGMYGSSDHQVADAAAATGFGRALSENETGIRYQDFGRWRDEVMQAMGLGTQYDLGMAGIDAQSQASANATNASSASSARGQDIQRELGNRGLLLDAMGQQNGLSQFGLGTMSDLSGMDVQNRQFMLGAIPAYHNIQMDDLGAAFGTNFNLEGAQAQQANQAANRRAQQAQQARNQPWNDLARYMDVINSASSGYNTTQEAGVRPGTQQPESNSWLAALQGGLGAAQSANNLYRGWNQGMGA